MTNRREFTEASNDEEIEIVTTKQDVAVVKEYKSWSNEMGFDEAAQLMKTQRTEPIFTAKFLNNTSSNTMDLNRLDTLCTNTQSDVNKVIELATYARKMANISDLHGKIIEAIENNVNPKFSIVYPQNVEGKNLNKFKKAVEQVRVLLDEKFFSVNNINGIIAGDIVPMAYLEGNRILNLMRTTDGYYSVENYPIGIAEISDYQAMGEPIVMVNMGKLKTGLDALGIKDKSKKKENGLSDYASELKSNYPEEVYKAFTASEKYAKLNPMTTGVIRNKNMGGKYGVTAFLPSFKAGLQLDTIDFTDNINARARAKKFVVQLLNEKLSGTSGKDKHFVELNYANDNLYAAATRDTVIMTAPAYVKEVKLLEFKNAPTPIENINYYRYQEMNALGISFLAAETNSKFTATQVSFSEIVKAINRLNLQLSAFLNKCIRYIVYTENSNLLDYCPEISIGDANWLDSELRLKLATFIFTTLGASYETAYGLLGLDADEEKRIRDEENEMGYNETFIARATAFTTTNDGTGGSDNTEKKPENQNEDKDKKANDKARTVNNK